MSMKIVGLQQAKDALSKELSKLGRNKFAVVGIHEDATAVKGADLTMATLGAIQHYGNDVIPARPWLDVGMESGVKEYLATVEEGITNGLTEEQILNQVGLIAAGYVQKYLTDLKTPPNATSTIKRKKSSNPLIDTGAMRQSVKHTLVNQEPTEGL